MLLILQPLLVTLPHHPRVLIATAGFGDGHNTAARGLAKALKGQAQSIIIDNGVPGLKITEWPTDSNVVPYVPGAAPGGCDSCPPVTEYKKSFINIPANVW